MTFSLKHFFLLLTVAGTLPSSVQAGDKVWVGLFLAENSPPPKESILPPDKLKHRLHEVFGFKHYQILKSGEIALNDTWQQWLLPRKDFFIRVEPLPKKSGEPRTIDYEIYQDGFIVAKGKYEPNDEEPLFINGPDFKSGRLLFVLESR